MHGEMLVAMIIWATWIALSLSSIPMALFAWKRPRLMRVLADATLIYPLIAVGMLYVQWILSWYMLGHKPIPLTDDPKYINGASWMHLITTVALLGVIPAGFSALAFNIAHICRQRSSAAQVSIRLCTLAGLWLGMFVTLARDSDSIMEWWMD
jgi:hypothetical protein